MAASYIDADYVDAALGGGTGRRTALFTPAGGSYTATAFTKAVEMASAIVQAAAQNAGYTLGDSSTNALVQLATFGQFIVIAYGNKGEQVPEQYASAVVLAEAIRVGDVPLPGLTTDSKNAVGGVRFSETSTSVTTSRPQLFSRRRLSVY